MNNRLNAIYGDKTAGNHYYLRARGDSTGPMELGTYVNPQLALHTDYFGSLDRMMKCVEKHAHADAKHFDKVCSSEMNALRRDAFQDKLLYHHVNARWFQTENLYKSGQFPY